MSLSVETYCPTCKKETVHDCKANLETDEIMLICVECKNTQYKSLDPDKMPMPLVPSKIPQIDVLIKAVIY